jgi:uncharacterized membrane protein
MIEHKERNATEPLLILLLLAVAVIAFFLWQAQGQAKYDACVERWGVSGVQEHTVCGHHLR